MSTETNSDDVPVNIISENQSETSPDEIISENSETNSEENTNHPKLMKNSLNY